MSKTKNVYKSAALVAVGDKIRRGFHWEPVNSVERNPHLPLVYINGICFNSGRLMCVKEKRKEVVTQK